MTEQRAREALEAQGFNAPGPKLVDELMNAIAKEEEAEAAAVRVHQFDYGELLADTPELADRTDGPLTDPATATSKAVAKVLDEAIVHVFHHDDA